VNRSFIVLAAGVIVGASCNTATGPETLPLAFTSGTSSVSGPPPVAAPVGIAGGIVLSGAIRSSCLPYTATGVATRQGQLVTLTTTGHPVDGCPQDAFGWTPYAAEIDGLTTGAFHLLVVNHDAMGVLGDLTFIDMTVVVP
jgi:hypothetical protein